MPGVMAVENARRILDEIEALPLAEQEVIAASLIKRLKWVAADDEEWNALADQVIEKHIDAWKELARR